MLFVATHLGVNTNQPVNVGTGHKSLEESLKNIAGLIVSISERQRTIFLSVQL